MSIAAPSPPKPAVSLQEAVSTYQAKDWKKAVDQLTSLLTDESDARVLEPLGLSHFHLGNNEVALEIFQRLSKLRNNRRVTAATHTNLGSCYFRLGEHGLAEEHYRKAIQKKSNGSAHFSLASLLAIQGKDQEALDWLERAVKLQEGFREQAKEDEDFETIRPYVRFKKIIEHQKDDRVIVWFSIGLFVILIVPALVVGSFADLLPTRFRKTWQRFLLSFAYRAIGEIDGVKIGVALSSEDVGPKALERIQDAMQLIREVWPANYRRITEDLDWISVKQVTDSGGEFEASRMSCNLDADYFGELECETDRQGQLVQIASVIVHEACHARLQVMGRNLVRRKSPAAVVYRVERLCRNQETRFLERTQSANLVDSTYDVPYWHRFGMWERWYYDRWQRQSRLRKAWVHLRELGDGEQCLYRQFQDYAWSKRSLYTEYVEDLRGSLDPESRDATAWADRASNYYRIMRYADAIDDYRQATRLDRKNADYYRLLGWAAGLNRDYDMATSALARAVKLNPTDESSLKCLFHLATMEPSDARKATKYTNRLAKLDPNQHRYMLFQAWANYLDGRYETALEFVQRGIRYEPENIGSANVAHLIYKRLNRVEEASASWEQCLVNTRKKAEALRRSVANAGVLLHEWRADSLNRNVAILTTPSSLRKTTELARRLVESASNVTSVEDEYTSGMLQMPIKGTVFELPPSVAAEKGACIYQMRIPQRFFHTPPALFDTIPIYLDRADVTKVVYRLET